MAEIFVGIDLGGTNIKIGCFDSNLNLLTETSVPTLVENGASDIVDRIGQTVESLLGQYGLALSEIAAAGIGTPGVVDVENGIVLNAPNLKFNDTPLRQMIRDRLGCPVVLENDANVTCWGEHVAGAGKGAQDMILITLGTGVGGGIISNGELVHGYANAGAEIGHMIVQPGGRLCGCGQKGCVEAYSSASSTARRAIEALQENAEDSTLQQVLKENGTVTCEDVYDHLAKGDDLARQITDTTAEYLALLCVSLLHVAGPERILFYGGMIAAGDLLLEPIKKYFRQHIWTLQHEEIELCFAELGTHAGIIGNAALATHRLEKGQLT
ncbi:Glucokinase [Anaerohalosphaera lusitana]|uniref:Glucokinase n=1 Tax=Anaerohalosphaera lusitana TaxID=1936003 RepID=A0A1U9NMH5_9BACT|nr:ROK family glucokinase [Anaerohalosphaera lusitana]AQT68997.1 Glucokinase [Anaerohalosphaera lusitana]